MQARLTSHLKLWGLSILNGLEIQCEVCSQSPEVSEPHKIAPLNVYEHIH